MEDLKNRLITAINNNDQQTAMRLINVGISRDTSPFINEAGPLICAVARNRQQIAEYLVEKGANINAPDSEGYSAFFCACSMEKLAWMEWLRQNGADINQQNHLGETPLMQSVYSDHQSVFDYLVKAGAKLDIKENNGYTALLHASGSRNPYYLKTLVDNGCDLNLGSSDGQFTPLMFACRSHDTEMAFYLIDAKADLDRQNHAGQTALMIACRAELLPTVQHLIKHGANINLRDENNMSAFDHAVGRKCQDIAQYLARLEQKQLEKQIKKQENQTISMEF